MNTDNKIILIFAALFLLISALMVGYAYFGVNVSYSQSSLERAKVEMSQLRASNVSVMSSISGGATRIVSTVPMFIVLALVIGVTAGMYNLLKIEKKKGRVSFIKSRDAKKIAPDLWAKNKKLERQRIKALNDHVSELERDNFDNEMADLARIAKINAMSGMARTPNGIPQEDVF